MIEYVDFYDNLQATSETLQCPRCSASVPSNPGVCSNCGENVFQCHKCRSVSYNWLYIILYVKLTYLDLDPPVPLGTSGDETSPSLTITAGCIPADTHLFHVFFECTLPCHLRSPPLSSAVFWHPVHCCMDGSLSLLSENVASHFPSPCCNNILESLHACSPHHPFICCMIVRCTKSVWNVTLMFITDCSLCSQSAKNIYGTVDPTA